MVSSVLLAYSADPPQYSNCSRVILEAGYTDDTKQYELTRDTYFALNIVPHEYSTDPSSYRVNQKKGYRNVIITHHIYMS